MRLCLCGLRLNANAARIPRDFTTYTFTLSMSMYGHCTFTKKTQLFEDVIELKQSKTS